MEKKIETRKDILRKLIKGNIVLGGTKLGTMLLPQLSVIGFIVPQYYITFMLLLILSTVVIKNNKKEQEKC